MVVKNKSYWRTGSSLLVLSIAFFAASSSSVQAFENLLRQRGGFSRDFIEGVKRAQKDNKGGEEAWRAAENTEALRKNNPTLKVGEAYEIQEKLQGSGVPIPEVTPNLIGVINSLEKENVEIPRGQAFKDFKNITDKLMAPAAGGVNPAPALTADEVAKIIKNSDVDDWKDPQLATGLREAKHLTGGLLSTKEDIQAFNALRTGGADNALILNAANPTVEQAKAYAHYCSLTNQAPTTPQQLESLVNYHTVTGEYTNTQEEIDQVNNLAQWKGPNTFTAEDIDNYYILKTAATQFPADVALTQANLTRLENLITNLDGKVKAKDPSKSYIPLPEDFHAAIIVTNIAGKANPPITESTLTVDQLLAAKKLIEKKNIPAHQNTFLGCAAYASAYGDIPQTQQELAKITAVATLVGVPIPTEDNFKHFKMLETLAGRTIPNVTLNITSQNNFQLIEDIDTQLKATGMAAPGEDELALALQAINLPQSTALTPPPQIDASNIRGEHVQGLQALLKITGGTAPGDQTPIWEAARYIRITGNTTPTAAELAAFKDFDALVRGNNLQPADKRKFWEYYQDATDNKHIIFTQFNELEAYSVAKLLSIPLKDLNEVHQYAAAMAIKGGSPVGPKEWSVYQDLDTIVHTATNAAPTRQQFDIAVKLYNLTDPASKNAISTSGLDATNLALGELVVDAYGGNPVELTQARLEAAYAAVNSGFYDPNAQPALTSAQIKSLLEVCEGLLAGGFNHLNRTPIDYNTMQQAEAAAYHDISRFKGTPPTPQEFAAYLKAASKGVVINSKQDWTAFTDALKANIKLKDSKALGYYKEFKPLTLGGITVHTPGFTPSPQDQFDAYSQLREIGYQTKRTGVLSGIRPNKGHVTEAKIGSLIDLNQALGVTPANSPVTEEQLEAYRDGYKSATPPGPQPAVKVPIPGGFQTKAKLTTGDVVEALKAYHNAGIPDARGNEIILWKNATKHTAKGAYDKELTKWKAAHGNLAGQEKFPTAHAAYEAAKKANKPNGALTDQLVKDCQDALIHDIKLGIRF